MAAVEKRRTVVKDNRLDTPRSAVCFDAEPGAPTVSRTTAPFAEHESQAQDGIRRRPFVDDKMNSANSFPPPPSPFVSLSLSLSISLASFELQRIAVVGDDLAS